MLSCASVQSYRIKLQNCKWVDIHDAGRFKLRAHRLAPIPSMNMPVKHIPRPEPFHEIQVAAETAMSHIIAGVDISCRRVRYKQVDATLPHPAIPQYRRRQAQHHTLHLRLRILDMAAIIFDRSFQASHRDAVVFHDLLMQISTAGRFLVIDFIVVATNVEHGHADYASDKVQIAGRKVSATDYDINVTVLSAQIDRIMQLRHFDVA